MSTLLSSRLLRAVIAPATSIWSTSDALLCTEEMMRLNRTVRFGA